MRTQLLSSKGFFFKKWRYIWNTLPIKPGLVCPLFSCDTKSDTHLKNTTKHNNSSLYTLPSLLPLCLLLFTVRQAFSVFDDATKFEHNVTGSCLKLCFPIAIGHYTPKFSHMNCMTLCGVDGIVCNESINREMTNRRIKGAFIISGSETT